jgi:hypothetical protein
MAPKIEIVENLCWLSDETGAFLEAGKEYLTKI